MAKAKALIKRRKVVQNTRKITRTMELVSTAKYKQSSNRIQSATPYRETLMDMMSDIASSQTQVDHPLTRRRDPARHVTVLLITSNRGLCGGFNTNLNKTLLTYLEEQRQSGVEVALHVVGKKGISYLRFLGVEMDGEYAHFGDRPTYEDVEKLADEFIAAYESARTDRVTVIYQHYLSGAIQKPWVEVLLPIPERARGEDAVATLVPARATAQVEYLYSPSASELLTSLLPAYFKTSLYHVFLETVVGEHRARMVAMKNASDNAKQMTKTLTRMYNRARQSQITNEISEIMGGVEALK